VTGSEDGLSGQDTHSLRVHDPEGSLVQVTYSGCFDTGSGASVLCREGNTTYGIAKAFCIVAGDAPSFGTQKQKRVAQSHSGPLRPDHRQQRLYLRPGADTEAKSSEGSTAQATTQQYSKSHP
jgi:hypothetical protein